MNDPDPATDPARARFFILQALRLSGVALAVLGVAVIAGKLPLPAVAGYVLLLAGVADAMILPPVLARKWRTPRP